MARRWSLRARRWGALPVLLAVVGVSAACGGSGEADASGGVPVASGIVLDGPGGEPRSGVEVELLVLPAALGASSGAAEGISADRAVADSEGRFTLDAHAADLTPHAGPDGRVRIEVKVVGGSLGTRTTVLVRKAPQTGVAEVVETTGLTLADD